MSLDKYLKKLRNQNMASPEHVRYCEPFMAQCERMKELIKDYGKNAVEDYETHKANATLVQYAVGGDMLPRGYYCPSPIIDQVVGNVNRGRIAKRITPKTKISHEYYFNSDGKLTAVKILPFDREVIYHLENRTIGLVLGSDDKISGISECVYKDGLIISYAHASYLSFRDEITYYELEEYKYENNMLKEADWYRLSPYIYILGHMRYTFEHDGEGYLTTYKAVEYKDGVPKPQRVPDINNEIKVRKIRKANEFCMLK